MKYPASLQRIINTLKTEPEKLIETKNLLLINQNLYYVPWYQKNYTCTMYICTTTTVYIVGIYHYHSVYKVSV